MAVTINGNGSVTGLILNPSDDSITTSMLQDSVITNAKLLKQSIAFYGRQTTGVSLSPSNWHDLTGLTTNSVSSNTGSSWNTTTGAFTVASGQEGKYLLFCGVGWSNIHRVDHVLAGISINGADPTVSSRNVSQYTSGSSTDVTAMVNHMELCSVTVGDVITANGYHNYQNNEDRTSANTHTFFGGVRIAGL